MLRITGGKVYDPANGIDGVVKDICIADGRIVSQVEGGRSIDATGLVVFPGGVDVHTHVAGAALNFARGLTPEHMRRALPFVHTPEHRAGLGGITPTTFATGYLYAGMGWTTVNEAAMPVLSARHTHEELHDTPIVDKSTLVLMANNEIVLDLLEAGEVERARHVVAWLIGAAKAYGVKAVNPGGVAAWKWGKDAKKLFESVEGYSKVTPAKIISEPGDHHRRPRPAASAPHPLQQPRRSRQLHDDDRDDEGPGGAPGAPRAPAVPRLRRRRLGLDALGSGHPRRVLQHAYELHDRCGGDPVRQRRDDHRRRPVAARALSAHRPQVGQPRRGERDRLRDRSAYVYKEHKLVNAIQWAVGLELLLLINDPWRVFLTTDHPNGACFWRYPELIRLLMDADYRRECVNKLPEEAQKRIVLADLDRKYTLVRRRHHHVRGPGARWASRGKVIWVWARTRTWRCITRTRIRA